MVLAEETLESFRSGARYRTICRARDGGSRVQLSESLSGL